MLQLPIYPTIDGYFLLDEPKNLIQSWNTKRADIMIGNVEKEGLWDIPYVYMMWKKINLQYDSVTNSESCILVRPLLTMNNVV